MKREKIILVTFLFLLLLQGRSLQAQAVWYDPLEETSLPIHGRGWNEETGRTYHRLPLRMKDMIRQPVWNLSRQSAGLYVKFYTNAPDIQVKYTVTGGLAMPHMPSTGVSGIDLYSTDANGNQYWCAGKYQFGDTIHYSYNNLTYRNPHNQGNEYSLYLPLYNSVKHLQIGVPEGCAFEFITPSTEKPIVVYGTSIAQGACASRPGMAWTNILQRQLDIPVINLGFSGNGQLDEDFVKFLSELDAGLFVIDCMPNMGGKRVEWIKERIIKAVGLIRARSQAPILLVEHDGYMGYQASDKEKENFTLTNEELQAAYTLLKETTSNLYYLTFEELGLSMDSQVDGVHASDLGMQQYADAYTKKIKSILYPAVDSSIFTPCRQRRDANTYQWNARHEEILKYNKEHQPEIVLIGNSITHYWGGLPYEKRRTADDVWQKLFKGRATVNMGFGWDRIENMLWRIRHGELDNFRAKKIFIMAGTNNLQQNTDEEIADGIRQLVEEVKAKQPEAQLYVIKIYPRRGFESRLVKLNKLLEARLNDIPQVQAVDFSPLLVNSDGNVKEELFSDGLHPNHQGYKIIAKEWAKYL